MNILIVDDEKGLRKGLGKMLSLKGHRVFEAEDRETAKRIMSSHNVEIMLLDLKLGIEDGYGFLKQVKEEEALLSVVIITGYGNIESAIRCMKAGAINYITKPIDQNLLFSIIEKEQEALAIRKENIGFRRSLKELSEVEIVPSRNLSMANIERIIGKVKDSDATILIQGETGSGKEIIARKIHFTGKFSGRPFIGVNCASLNDNLLESELFGHEKGAFTGASERKLGRFEIAGEGTLFLDEIGDMSGAMQSKLLRVLQEKTFERVGGVQSLSAHCRIIAATNKHLLDYIKEGRFREDLYYRLSLVTITLPPLRKRKEDIPLLVEQFINEANLLYERNVKKVPADVMEKIMGYEWPGNIRQLKNVIVNAVILSEDEMLSHIDLPGVTEALPFPEVPGENLKTIVGRHVCKVEQHLIDHALKQCRGNISKTARQLGITRKTLYEKLRQYNL
ncbi:MAG: sigma-54-dependent Fis family transcriptional regulator [Spirochaetales bacterium]|nr:sigma-54-dependent Fis family transcriptional regulator [Spirochaetales bacterium]